MIIRVIQIIFCGKKILLGEEVSLQFSKIFFKREYSSIIEKGFFRDNLYFVKIYIEIYKYSIFIFKVYLKKKKRKEKKIYFDCNC